MKKRRPMRPGAFNLYKEQPKESGCRACGHNIMGVCVRKGKEVPITSGVANRKPKWCPGETK